MPNPPTLADYHANDGGGLQIFGQAAKEVPSAISELASEAWEHPGAAIGHAAKTVVEAGVMGTAIGYLVPARGPASILVGVTLTAPAVWNAGRRLYDAHEQAKNPYADQRAIAHALARDTVTGTTDLGLSFAGGYAGAELGYALAGSKGAVGRFAQKTQRSILNLENKGMAWASTLAEGRSAAIVPKIDIYSNVGGRTGAGSASSELVRGTTSEPVLTRASSVAPEKLPFGQRTFGILNRRVEQFTAPVQTITPEAGWQIVQGPLHGHSRYSDGMATPAELYGKAKSEGYDFAAVTDHNHVAARGGVKPDDVRAHDQAGTPTVAEDPILYAQTFADATAATENGKFVGLVGIELGTIGKVGGGHGHQDFIGEVPPSVTGAARPTDITTGGVVKPGEVNPGVVPKDPPPARIDIEVKPPQGTASGTPEHVLPTIQDPVGPVGKLPGQEAPPPTLSREPGKEGSMSLQEMQAEAVSGQHLGGVNHINLFEVPTFLESVRQPRGTVDAFIQTALGRDAGPIIKKPDVVKINDGDYRALADHLDNLKDTTGGTPVVQFNHPRFRADENPNLPRGDRARDYGQKSFKSKQEWLDRFVDPYVRQIELIKGGALNPDPVDVVAPGQIDATSFAGYLDKGVHASPTFGRDYHYGDPGGNPGATGILVRGIDKPSIMDGLRNRRTIATTNGDKLTGSMWANDRHPMGSILDQAAIEELGLSARIGGEVVPDAQYTVKLWGDTKVGDKNLAEVLSEQTITGKELLAQENKVSFDPLQHVLGRKSVYYMEIQRTDPGTGHVDKMWTAPIWVEPLTGAKHSFYMRWLSGNSANFLDAMVRRK